MNVTEVLQSIGAVMLLLFFMLCMHLLFLGIDFIHDWVSQWF